MKLHLNILAFLSTSVMFLFNLLLGRIFGLTKQLDLFFASNTLIIYLSNLIQIVFEGSAPFYAELNSKNKEEADRLYSVMLNNTLVFGIILFLCVQILHAVISKYYFKGLDLGNFFRIFAIILILKNVDLLNKTVMRLNYRFSIVYISDILVFCINLVFVYLFHKTYDIMVLPISYSISYIIVILIQSLYLKKVLEIKYFLQFKHNTLLKIIKGSLWIKTGSILYSSKDVIISQLLLGLRPGIYSIYSYALKFTSAINTIVNAPVINVFSTEAIYMIANKEYVKLKIKIKKVIYNLLVIFIPTVIFSLLIIPKILEIFMNIEYVKAIQVKNIFFMLSLFNFINVVSAPYARILTPFKRFDLTFWNSVIFICSFIFSLVFLFDKDINSIIISLIIANFIHGIFYVYFSIKLLNKSRGVDYENIYNNADI